MATQLPGEQVEHAFNSKRLCNWQVPREDPKLLQNTIGGSRFGTLKARTGKTQFIVDDKGYLLSSVGKLKTAFTTQVPVYAKSSARWPQENPAIRFASRATMGYKGIQTDYLPTSTVSLKSVEINGAREMNYSFR